MKDYTQADMDSAIIAYEREKKLREIAVENFERMRKEIEGVPEKAEKLEKLRVKIVGYMEKVRDMVRTPQGLDRFDALRVIGDSFDDIIKELEALK